MPVYFSNPMCMCAAASGFKALSVYIYLKKLAIDILCLVMQK